MNEIENKIYSILKKIAKKRDDKFSGIGIIVYDEDKFDESCHTDLRPDFKLQKISVDDENIVDKLLEYSDYRCDLHDGFDFMNTRGILTHVAQYYVPPVIKEIYPNQKHGVRTYSAACGSKVQGVDCVAIISSDNDIFIYKDGKELINDTSYIIEK